METVLRVTIVRRGSVHQSGQEPSLDGDGGRLAADRGGWQVPKTAGGGFAE